MDVNFMDVNFMDVNFMDVNFMDVNFMDVNFTKYLKQFAGKCDNTLNEEAPPCRRQYISFTPTKLITLDYHFLKRHRFERGHGNSF